MSYLVPYSLALKPGEEAVYHSFILQGEPDIPDDTYQLLEWYCPNPACNCQDVRLEVYARDQKRTLTAIYLGFNPAQALSIETAPPESDVPYLAPLVDRITKNLKSDLAYIYRLRSHYNQVKAAAADPDHPAYSALIQWGNTGGIVSPAKKRRRKRH